MEAKEYKQKVWKLFLWRRGKVGKLGLSALTMKGGEGIYGDL